MRKEFIAIIGAPFLAAFMIMIHVFFIFQQGYEGEKTTFTVKPGEGFSSINYRLYKAGLINNTRLFHYYARYKKSMTKFKAGTYEIKNGQTMTDVLESLVNGVPILESVTIPEGKNLFEIAKILEAKNICSAQQFILTAKNPEFTQSLGIPAERVEGYLYPDTYRFNKKTPAKQVIKTMVTLFRKKFATLDMSKTTLAPHEVVILASIVEKETGAKFERPLISGVFHNRLKKRMRLQSDPTTIYGIYENYNGNLRKKHLLEKTPYNTYKIPALPKGPISNPGLDALKAVLNPKQHDYLYFVSHNDGTHEFTKTYKEHLKAVEKYQKTRSNRVGKSWRNLKQKQE